MSTAPEASAQAAPVNGAAAHLAGAKALLAQKMAQKENPATFSPTDNMMTPTSAKISQVKKKHFTKGKPLSGPRFGAMASPLAPQKLGDEQDTTSSAGGPAEAPES